MRRSSAVLLATAALAMLATAGPVHAQTVAAAAPVATVPAASTQPAWARAMLRQVNVERAKAGVRPLVLCRKLSTASAKYAGVMARTGHFDHTGPDGRQPWDRGEAEGYHYTSYGENIAAGQPTVGAVMDAWIHSPGHYANIVNRRFTHLGVGRASSTGEYSTYWVQNFGAGGRC